jgi:hypothetical protein
VSTGRSPGRSIVDRTAVVIAVVIAVATADPIRHRPGRHPRRRTAVGCAAEAGAVEAGAVVAEAVVVGEAASVGGKATGA